MKFRSVIFWIHLAAGLGAGAIIFIMSVTGVALAFEKEILAWAEGGTQEVRLPRDAADKLSLNDLLFRFREKRPDAKPTGLTVTANPNTPIQIAVGRTEAYYLNPYTGELCGQTAPRVRAFLRFMTDWHRWLGREGDGRAVGKAITGACNLAFLFLAVSGLYLWWPRQWSRAALKGAAVLSLRLRGKARDWNWHNAIGLWAAPVLIVLTASGTVISYRWASDLAYRVAGETPPPPGQGPPGGNAAPIPAPSAGDQPLPADAVFMAVKKAAPSWELITLRLEGSGTGRNQENKDPARPLTVLVRERGAFPWFGSDQFSIDPWTGSVIRRETFWGYSTGRQIRMWLRFLHTGEALGLPGKIVASVASLGGAFLVFTGVSLACRRFWPRRATARGPVTGGTS